MGAADRPWTADRRILRLLQYWRDGRPGPGLLPGRQAIDPIVLGPDLLPLMALVEPIDDGRRSEEHTSQLQSLMRISYADFCLKKKNETKAIHKHRLDNHTTKKQHTYT